MRALIITVALLIPAFALAQSGSSGGSSSGGASSGGASTGGGFGTTAPAGGGSSGVTSPPSVAPNLSPTQTAPVGSSPVAPNVSPTQTTPVTGSSDGQVRPDPSPTQAAPVQTPSPGGGTRSGAIGGAAPATGAASGRQIPGSTTPEAEAAQREREAREARLRASEERLRRLIRDICTGCDYGPRRSNSTTDVNSTSNVVRVKG